MCTFYSFMTTYNLLNNLKVSQLLQKLPYILSAGFMQI